MSSSPRDHKRQFSPRFSNCARMPSNFHSMIQSEGGPKRWQLSRPVGGPRLRQIERIGLARVERVRFRMADLADQRLEIRRLSGSAASANSRSAAGPSGPSSTPATSASAFTTCSRDTPTRSSPVMSLKKARRSCAREVVRPLLEPRVTLFLAKRGKRQQPLAHPYVERNLCAPLPSGRSNDSISARSPTAP